MFIVPAYPLYITSGLLCLIYLYRYWESRKEINPTNYTFLGKAFAWGLMASLYFWAGNTGENIIIVRNYVRLGNLLLFTIYLSFAVFEIWLKKKYK